MDIVAATAIQLLHMFHPVAIIERTESSARVPGSRPMWARGLFSTLPAELDISVESQNFVSVEFLNDSRTESLSLSRNRVVISKWDPITYFFPSMRDPPQVSCNVFPLVVHPCFKSYYNRAIKRATKCESGVM